MMDHFVDRIAFWTEQCELRESALKKAEARVAHLEDANRAMKDAADTASGMVDDLNTRVAGLEAAQNAVAFVRLQTQFDAEWNDATASNADNLPETPDGSTQAASGGGEQPRGWLTDEEREAVETARDYFDNEDLGDSECVFIARMMKQILARSTPPEVVKPNEKHYHHITCSSRDAEWIAAIAKAGVPVKEVPRD
jgi:hypothetical protein